MRYRVTLWEGNGNWSSLVILLMLIIYPVCVHVMTLLCRVAGGKWCVFSRLTDFLRIVSCLRSPQHSSDSWGITKPVFLSFLTLSLPSLPPFSLSVSHLTYSRSIISCWVTGRARRHRVLQFTAPLLAFLLHFLVLLGACLVRESNAVWHYNSPPAIDVTAWKQVRVREMSKWESLPGNMTDSCSKWLGGS